MADGGIAIYLAGVALVWFYAARAVYGEPTAHGQSILIPMGCSLGLFWPLFLAYLIVASPWIALTWWQTREERR